MAPPAPPLRSLTLEGPVLTRSRVAALSAQLDAGAPLVVDCHALRSVDPDGLCALLDLAHARDTSGCALAALQPALLRAALEVGLARGFAICKDVDAANALLLREHAAPCGQ